MKSTRMLVIAGVAVAILVSARAGANVETTWTETQMARLARVLAPRRLDLRQRSMARALFGTIHEHQARHEDRTLPLWVRTRPGLADVLPVDEIARVLWGHKHREHLDSLSLAHRARRAAPKNMGRILILDHPTNHHAGRVPPTELESLLGDLIEYDHYGVVVLVDEENAFDQLEPEFKRKLTLVDLSAITECAAPLENVG